MTNLFIDEVAQYLESLGIGVYSTDLGRNMFIGNMPDNVDEAICIYDNIGQAAEIEIPLFKPSFQIVVRDTVLTNGETLVQSIRTALHNKYDLNFVTNGTFVYSCNLSGHGGHIGRDDKGRDMFSLNFNCLVR